MAAAAEAKTKAHAARLRRRCHELIGYAEKLKLQQAAPFGPIARQPEILLRASRLHGNEFPPWTTDPHDDEFECLPGANLYT